MRPATLPAARPGGPFRIGEWTVHPERNLLESPDASHRLEPKAMDTLVVLAGRAGEVVTKDALIDGVWEGRIISEGTLTNTVAELRSALGDDARRPRYIETIPKRGYRLLCQVEPVEEAPDNDGAPADQPRSRRRMWIVPAAVLAAALAASLAAVLLSRQLPLNSRVVLVAPFANRTGDHGLDPLTTLARDRVAAQLSESGIARPVPAGGSAAAAALDELCREAREHGAGFALAGALYLHEGEVEVQAQLIDVAEGSVLYAVPGVTGPKDRAAELLQDASQRALGALATQLYAHAHSSLLSRPPVFEAGREFLAGSEIFVRDLPAAIEHLERAVEIDPDFTSAQLRLAVGLRLAGRGEEGRAILDGLHARRAGLTDFERLWLDAFVADFEGRWADALACLDGARRLTPSDWTLLYLIANHELDLNRPRRAISVLGEMHSLELPDIITRHGLFIRSHEILALAWHIVGDHSAELAAARAGRARFPADRGLMVAEAKALAALGDLEGLEAVLTAAGSTPAAMTPANVLVESAATARAHARPELASSLAARAVAVLDRPDGSPVDHLLLAEALVQLGELERAQPILEAVAGQLQQPRQRLALPARGWLGVVAARRGDLETARAVDAELAAFDDPYLYGKPACYRAAIAAWLGHRDRALELLREARAAGWGSFELLHDEERVLFEPLEGMAEYDATLRPSE
jgi:DNA-binding winged helix-turn-helix (wHTH) protein/tetratricopeptide (TPR) repeat protein